MDELAPLVAEATHEQEDVLFITSSNANKVAFDPSAHISMPSAQFRVQVRNTYVFYLVLSPFISL